MIRVSAECSGHVAIDVSGPRGHRRLEFNNLITDYGLNSMAANSIGAIINRCGLGSGATTPTPGEVSLVAPASPIISSGSTVTGNSGAAPWYNFTRKTFTFTAGSITGPVAEVGIFATGFANTMFSRALVRDAAGNPTSIEVRPDETISVTYELRKWAPESDQSGSFQLDVYGAVQTINYTIRAANVNGASSYWRPDVSPGDVGVSPHALIFSTATLGAVTTTQTGTATQSMAASSQAYQSGTFRRNATAAFPVTTAAFPDGIGSALFAKQANDGAASASSYGYQVSFSPKIPVVNGRNIGIAFFMQWGRK